MEIIFPLTAIVAPLFSALLTKVFGRSMGERSAWIGIVALALSLFGSLVTLMMVVYGPAIHLTVLPGWSGAFAYTLLVDRLAAVMMVLISVVSLVIHMYSERYMVGDPGFVRFFGLLSLLTFVLLGLVTSGNLLWLLLCWHLITWLLAALLAFNAASRVARDASRRTLWVQGLGDAAFAAALGVLYLAYGTLDLGALFGRLEMMSVRPSVWLWMEWDVLSLTTLLLLLAVMTKSAQVPFHLWLPGTIEAPTPVSALLHAGIINAGGFLVNRLAPLYGLAPTTLHVMFVIGWLTALIGATTMLTQSSIKRTLVYSTMGQMGYMIMECGLGAFALAVFHLCAHGLFKAALFLNSGANIHKARTDYILPPEARKQEAAPFSALTWTTGFAVTLILPLVIVLAANGVVHIPLADEQGAVIFLFFGWVTASQVMFSLYRLHAGSSWKVSGAMLGALALIGLTYLWAGETFTHFLYPAPGEAAAYFQAAEWPAYLFNAVVLLSTLLIIAFWVMLYGKARGETVPLASWMLTLRTRAYVAFLNGLYFEELARAGRRWRRA